MNRINKKFQQLSSKGGKAMVAFITAADPDVTTSLDCIKAMLAAGVDVLELGVAFSDPTADGPVIQRSSARAIKAGSTLPGVLEMVTEIRKDFPDTPIILFSYYNPIIFYGLDKFRDAAMAAGADGVLIVDLPPEESDELTGGWPDDSFSLIRLIAPTTSTKRVETICKKAQGFIYMISRKGVTGAGSVDGGSISERVKLIKSHTPLPVCVGFGISTTQDAKLASEFADGIVVGSAFETTIENSTDHKQLPKLLAKQARELKDAIL